MIAIPYPRENQINFFRVQELSLNFEDYTSIDFDSDSFVAESYTSNTKPSLEFPLKPIVLNSYTPNINTEQARQQNEEQRIKQEEERVEADKKREENQKSREDVFSTLKPSIDTLTQKVDDLNTQFNATKIADTLRASLESKIDNLKTLIDTKQDNINDLVNNAIQESIGDLKS